MFLDHPTVVSVQLSASIERCFVSRMPDFSQKLLKFAAQIMLFYFVGLYNSLFVGLGQDQQQHFAAYGGEVSRGRPRVCGCWRY